MNGKNVSMKQKTQGKKIDIVEAATTTMTTTTEATEAAKKSYIEQRARGAYIATICQPEATFDLSIAAQVQEPSIVDIKALNKRLEWQMQNMDRGITYVPINLDDAKIFVFADASFANNKDLSSQIGYVIIIGEETRTETGFKLRGNLIHWSSTKSKRVTRSVLASEIYAMVNGTDMAFAITTTINSIAEQLGKQDLPLVVCTDSFSLYECIVKLGTTKEKRLMIDIMALRQMYEKRELIDVRWIEGKDNPADAMTKTTPNTALKRFLDTNEVDVKVDGWVERGGITREC
jgi:hypothetical protein